MHFKNEPGLQDLELVTQILVSVLKVDDHRVHILTRPPVSCHGRRW